MQIGHSLTEGSVRRQLILFSFPFFLSSLIQNLYMTADMLIVQWVNGAAGSSAVGIGGEIVSAFTFLIIGFASGGTVLISQYVAARGGCRADDRNLADFVCLSRRLYDCRHVHCRPPLPGSAQNSRRVL